LHSQNELDRIKTGNQMIIIPVKEGENIERALKKFKRKFEKTGTVKELRSRQAYQKPSVRRRMEYLKAVYIQQLQAKEENE
jgi:small subunit ribosomal protein S21